MLPIEKLEAYTVECSNEVLVVQASVDGVADEIVVFRGYSSSTVRPTAADLNVPVLPEGGAIVSISRLKAPYNPQSPDVLEADISWDEFAQRYING
ncbi:MAG: hypothetical protein AAGM36_06275 [Cyanobacteria bacterium J06597_1]